MYKAGLNSTRGKVSRGDVSRLESHSLLFFPRVCVIKKRETLEPSNCQIRVMLLIWGRCCLFECCVVSLTGCFLNMGVVSVFYGLCCYSEGGVVKLRVVFLGFAA